MKLFRRICLSFTCALVSAASLAGAQQAPPPAPDSTNVGAIAGVVRDERGQPMARARVAIEALAPTPCTVINSLCHSFSSMVGKPKSCKRSSRTSSSV